MSPRRSSRARSSQQPQLPAGPHHTNSSSSSTLSRSDREPRAANRSSPPRRPSTQRSVSADGTDSASQAELLAPRRSRRNGDDKDAPTKQPAEDDDDDADGGEEEVTRCICGQAEYPGPSPTVRALLPNPDDIADDTGGFFVQCDKCGVWQHGGCMGLTDETHTPEEYYCELCKPQFHKIIKSSNWPKTSRYLPFVEAPSNRSSPLSSNPEPARKKESKMKQSEITKRRATMNSRSVYDEEEALRRAIEESKEPGALKRSRDEGDEQKQTTKRQRTGSHSSSATKRSESPPAADQEDTTATNGKPNAQKLRGAAARTNREKEAREKQKEQQAAQRAEVASKRNARAERRRGEESPPPTPSISPSKAADKVNIKAKADSPPSGRANGTKKTGRPPARRGRLGRNQYTRDINGNGDTPLRDTSLDINGASPNGANGINGESGRSSKAKTHPARTSLNEMKRRVAAILEFVGHMQTEKGQQSRQSSGNSSSVGANTPNGVKELHLPIANFVVTVRDALQDTESDKKDDDGQLALVDEKDFNGMGSQQMMEALTKELLQWQHRYGVYSR